MGRKFVVGDIHGAGRALDDCLKKVIFDFEKDTLVCLGDVCDGWPDVRYAIEQLLKVKNLKYIMGNHDQWALQWMQKKEINDMWPQQGGVATMTSYSGGIPSDHVDLLAEALDYFLLENRLFVHGGIIPDTPLDDQGRDVFLWDRTLIEKALKQKKGNVTSYDEIYVGHTPTLRLNTNIPQKHAEVRMLDTGAGWRGGKLTIMDIDSKEFWQSEAVESYYPGVRGRG